MPNLLVASRLPAQERQRGGHHRGRRFDLRVMAHAGQFDDVRVRDQFAIARHHVRAGNRIVNAIDQADGNRRPLQGADPALAMQAPLGHVADKFRQ